MKLKTIATLTAVLLLGACSAAERDVTLAELYRATHPQSAALAAEPMWLPQERVHAIVECDGLTGADPARAADLTDNLVRELCIIG